MAERNDTVREFVQWSIDEGRLLRGERLPSERVLAERLGLSRGAVRESLSVLEAEGLVRRRHGSGTYVNATVMRAMPGTASGAAIDVSPAQLMEARLLLEPQFAELVVANATAADLALIERCNRGTDTADDWDEFNRWNAEFHQAIAAATHNDFLTQVFALVRRAQQQGQWGALSKTPASPELMRAYRREHNAIVQALRDRHVEAARTAIRDHLRHARHNLLGY